MQNSIRTVLLFRREYLRTLISTGHEVYCIAPVDDEPAAEELRQLGVTVIPVKAGSILRNAVSMSLSHRRLYRSTQGKLRTICHFLTTIVMTYPSLVFTRSQNMVVIEGLGSFLHSKTIFQPFFRLLLKTAAARRIFMNRYEKAKVGTSEDIVLNGIGIPIERFYQGRQSKRPASDSINLLYVGRLIDDKGIYDAINVFETLYQKNNAYTLNLVGDIYPKNPSSLTSAQIEDIESRFGHAISFHGFKRNIIDYYQASDVLLLLSRHEGFPVVVMEANACGVPVVSYDVPGCNDAVSPGVNGFLVKHGDTQAVVDVLLQINPKDYVHSCIAYAEENFDRNKKNKRILEVLDTL